MIDFTSLAWFAVYCAAFLGIGLALRQIAGWSDGTSLADMFGGYSDPPWPRGVQEEELVRWNVAALGRRESSLTRTGPDRLCPAVPGFAPRQAARPRA